MGRHLSGSIPPSCATRWQFAEAGRNAEIRYLGDFDNTRNVTAKLVRKLSERHEVLHFCYEAGPTGYGLSVRSGFVELGVIVARLPWLRIAAITLPLLIGPIAPATDLSTTSLCALTAACAGSYWPAVMVPLSSVSICTG